MRLPFKLLKVGLDTSIDPEWVLPLDEEEDVLEELPLDEPLSKYCDLFAAAPSIAACMRASPC